jgi:hypothetical protein
MLEKIKAWWRNEKYQRTRTVGDRYLRGYRRLATFESQCKEGKCWCCKHAVGYVSWWCDREARGCKWERCYLKKDLTRADLNNDKWLGLPDPRERKK